jgi:hypothetical protein
LNIYLHMQRCSQQAIRTPRISALCFLHLHVEETHSKPCGYHQPWGAAENPKLSSTFRAEATQPVKKLNIGQYKTGAGHSWVLRSAK